MFHFKTVCRMAGMALFFLAISLSSCFAENGSLLAMPLDEETFSTETVSASKSVAPAVTPEDALRLLAAGNAKIIGDQVDISDLPVLSKDDQRYPIATVLCSDGTADPTTIFGLDKGDLYQIPVRAGVVTVEEMSDLDFGVVHLHSPVIVVLSDFPNRDVQYVVAHYDELKKNAEKELESATSQLGSNDSPTEAPVSDDTHLYTLIGPAVARVKEANPELSAEELETVVSEAIAWQSLEAILNSSDAVVSLLRDKQIELVAGMVDNTSGRITWLGSHPLQDEFTKEIPKKVKKQREQQDASSMTESDFSDPLTEEQVVQYVDNAANNNSCCTIVNQYYTVPCGYLPHWRLFYPCAWVYYPWYGCSIPAYIPWYTFDPWYYGYGPYIPYRCRPSCGFFLGFSIGFGVGLHYGAAFHPWDPYWDCPFYRDITHCPCWVAGSIYDALWHGAHHGPGCGPPPPGGGPDPHGFYGPGFHGPGWHGPGWNADTGWHGPGVHGPGWHGPGWVAGPDGGPHGPGAPGKGPHGPGDVGKGPGDAGKGPHGPGDVGKGPKNPGNAPGKGGVDRSGIKGRAPVDKKGNASLESKGGASSLKAESKALGKGEPSRPGMVSSPGKGSSAPSPGSRGKAPGASAPKKPSSSPASRNPSGATAPRRGTPGTPARGGGPGGRPGRRTSDLGQTVQVDRAVPGNSSPKVPDGKPVAQSKGPSSLLESPSASMGGNRPSSSLSSSARPGSASPRGGLSGEGRTVTVNRPNTSLGGLADGGSPRGVAPSHSSVGEVSRGVSRGGRSSMESVSRSAISSMGNSALSSVSSMSGGPSMGGMPRGGGPSMGGGPPMGGMPRGGGPSMGGGPPMGGMPRGGGPSMGGAPSMGGMPRGGGPSMGGGMPHGGPSMGGGPRH